MQVEFVGQSSRDADNTTANTSRLLNLYREPVPRGGITRYALRSVPGMVELEHRVSLVVTPLNLGGPFMRALKWADGAVYAACAGTLHKVEPGTPGLYVATSLGAIGDNPETSLSSNYGQVTAVSGGTYYLWDGSTLTTPSTGAITGDIGSVTYVAGYTVLTEKDGRRIQWSDLADPATFDALNTATADVEEDRIVRAMRVSDALWIFKERTTEVFYATGEANENAFIRQQGGTLRTGLKGFDLAVEMDKGVFFVGDDNVAYLATTGQAVEVSNGPVNEAIKNGSPTHCFYYEFRGRTFCVIRFSDRPSWVFDIKLGEWHERAEGREFGPWGVLTTAKLGDVWIAGSETGAIVKLEDVQEDYGEPLHRRAVSKTLNNEGKRFRVKSLEFFGAYGVTTGMAPTADAVALGGEGLELDGYAYALSETDDTRPKLMLEVSKDFGHTFGPIKTLSMGAVGEYDHRIIKRALGQYRQFTVRLTMTNGEEIPIYADAALEVA